MMKIEFILFIIKDRHGVALKGGVVNSIYDEVVVDLTPDVYEGEYKHLKAACESDGFILIEQRKVIEVE